MKPTAPTRVAILDVPADDLLAFCQANNIPNYRLKQVYEALFRKGAQSFNDISTLSAPLRALFETHFSLHPLTIDKKNSSQLDGTIRFHFLNAERKDVSTVFLPEGGRLSLCLSSQVGCAYRCTFCASGLVPFKRQLSAAEIVDQILLIQADQKQTPTNLLFMGMGEPLANYANVQKAIRWITSPEGLGMSASRITLSTSGLIPGIERMADDGMRVKLAISLHAVRDELRKKIMPVSGEFGVRELIKAAKNYAYKSKAEVTFEYILLAGVNDRLADVIRLSYLVKDFAHHVNLIPYNPVPGLRYERPEEADVLRFQKGLRERGVTAFIRRPKGLDIGSACGQLGPATRS